MTGLKTSFANRAGLFASESFSEGHPDKVCDSIADSVLDAFLEKDPRSRVACDVICNESQVVIGGRITSRGAVDVGTVVRRAVRDIGYAEQGTRFHAGGVSIQNLLEVQLPDIAMEALDSAEDIATDQGIVFGFASRETPELMPLPITLANRINRQLADARKSGAAEWLRPDSNARVTVRYGNGGPVEVTDLVVTTQHAAGIPLTEIRRFFRKQILPRALGEWWEPKIRTLINPCGEFITGGPVRRCGVSGRKTIADTYGGFARHGGGVLSGRDATKLERSAAYFARFVARQIVLGGLAERAGIQIVYLIGKPHPASLRVETFGTGDPKLAERYALQFDFRPSAIIKKLGLRRPIYRKTTNYGHFGKPWLKWEQ